MSKNLVVWISLFLLVGCTCQQKVTRLHKQCPEVFQAYTITVHDSVFLPGIANYDTTFFMLPGDTIRIDTGKIHIQFIRVNDTVFTTNLIQEPDTVHFTHTVNIEKVKEVKIKVKGFFYYIGIFALIFLIIAFLGLCIKVILKFI